MTDDARKARDEHLISAFAVVLTAGFSIDAADEGLFIHKREHDFIIVKASIVDGRMAFVEERFNDVRSAIGYFLDLHDEIGST